MGIGEAIAKRLAKDGANVVLMSRSKVRIFTYHVCLVFILLTKLCF